MHINILFRKALYVFLSLAIIAAPTIQANAASGWTISSSVSSGSRAIVTASKAGYKGAVNIAPTAGRLALKLGKGANWAALAYAAIQLAPPLADISSFQPNYANDRVDFKVKGFGWAYSGDNFIYPDAASACAAAFKPHGKDVLSVETINSDVSRCVGNNITGTARRGQRIVNDSISIPSAAAQMIQNAKNGHAPSQAAIAETATEMVGSGAFDADLLSGAVPINDSRPLIPAVPGNQNGNITSGSDVGVGTGEDGLMTGGDLGVAADAAIAAADAAKKAAQAAIDAYKAGADAARKAADDAQDVINSNVDQALKDLAKAGADSAAQAAKDLEAVKDAAKNAAKDAADKAARDAEKAKEAADRELQKAKDAAEKAAIEDKAKADEAVRAAEKEAAKAKDRADEAEKALEKAKAEAAKPFELPAFCTWAKVVCDYTEWVKAESVTMKEWLKTEAVPLEDENVEIDETMPDGWIDKANAGYVSFQSQCPNDVEIPINYMGVSQNIKLSYIPFCRFASLIKPAVILGAWISGLLIISGGRGRE